MYNIQVLKWFLLGFKDLSSMKIKFSKCELVPLNVSEHEGNQLAEQLGYKVSSLPLMYLDMSFHWKKLIGEQWNFLIEKIENKLHSWKGKLLSLGGRIVLLNSVLSFLLLYWMALFRLPTKLKIRIDQLRKRFLWYGGTTVKKNIHWLLGL
jgi:hypothetical protein